MCIPEISPISQHFFQFSHTLCSRLLVPDIPSFPACSFVRSRIWMSCLDFTSCVYELFIKFLLDVCQVPWHFKLFFPCLLCSLTSSQTKGQHSYCSAFTLCSSHLCVAEMLMLFGGDFSCCCTDLWKYGQVSLVSGSWSTHKDLSRKLHCTDTGY